MSDAPRNALRSSHGDLLAPNAVCCMGRTASARASGATWHPRAQAAALGASATTTLHYGLERAVRPLVTARLRASLHRQQLGA